jgi:probable F420-dependent oxidoreductase
MQLGRVGIWSGALRSADPGRVADAAAELEGLGYGTLWIPGGSGGDVFGPVERLLAATTTACVATGILNLWSHAPQDVATADAAIRAAHPGRFLLGIGVSHASLVERLDQVYERPLAKTAAYLDALDAADPPVPVGERALAALGPKMLEFARDRSAGAHPYLVSPDHTAFARGILGPGPLLAPEQKVLLETDPTRARHVARDMVRHYLLMPNYANNLRRSGFDEEDLAGEGSDRLVDGLVAWGDVDAIGRRVRAHLDAGADHVCLQVLGTDPAVPPLDEWRRLAAII